MHKIGANGESHINLGSDWLRPVDLKLAETISYDEAVKWLRGLGITEERIQRGDFDRLRRELLTAYYPRGIPDSYQKQMTVIFSMIEPVIAALKRGPTSVKPCSI